MPGSVLFLFWEDYIFSLSLDCRAERAAAMGKAKKPNKRMEDEREGGGEKNAMREKSSDKRFAKPLRGISKQSPSRPAVNLVVQNKIIEKMKMSSENMSRGQRKRLAKKSNVIRRSK